MTISNKERVGRALDCLQEGIYAFVKRELKNSYGVGWLTAVTQVLQSEVSVKQTVEERLEQDVSVSLKVIDRQWREVFSKPLGKAERSLVNELIEVRNTWAHRNFSLDDAYRALDSVARLLAAISAPQAEAVEKQKQELLRTRYEEQARRETRRTVNPIEGTPAGGFKPWREVITPHPDIASGRYQQAEFAADLWEVYKDRGSDEYRLPTDFFQRTYLTEGLKELLSGALQRLSGMGGDPVIELQTNFGGGKTHAMLALYHLCSGVPAKDLPGLEPVFSEAGVHEPPQDVNIVVLVGQKISPGQPDVKKDGTVVRTLWGEIAWQLGGRQAFERVRQADETSTNPGDVLRELFNQYAPCLILIDEWVAYARQLHDQNDLPGGSFDTHFTFVQAISEAAKNADRTLLVASIPASDIEKGGERGEVATQRLKNALGRVESPWRSATAEESFEIVRRRLFQPITDQSNFVARDAVVREFAELYKTQPQEFPSECREASYKKRLEEAYPIHPELFDRLYSDWSSLDKFQRTRGVLRLMAKVIHSLWERDDRSLLIMPSSVALDDAQVQSELTHYLDDNWVPIIEKDVDGSNSLPRLLDSQNPNLGRYSACRRVTRTIYLGSAPTLRAANRGIEDRRIKLGCVQPGESAAIFGDALRRLTDQATYLYVDSSNRYWIATQPNVTRTAQDRATQIGEDRDRLWAEIIRRLKQDKQRGEFTGVHIAPDSSADVPDDNSMGARLVILGPQHTHIGKTGDSPARQYVAEILNQRGASPRYYKNLLLFLAADQAKLENLEKNIAQYLAWSSIVTEKESLNLDVFQSNQATAKRDQSNRDVDGILSETYQWLLIPSQPEAQGAIQWDETRLQGQDNSLIQRASRKLVHEDYLIANYSPSRLCLDALNPYFWQESNHIDLKKLWDFFSQYLYLPRLKNPDVLLRAIQDGIASTTWAESFAHADGWDAAKERYLGLKTGELVQLHINSQSLLVKPDVAIQQIEADRTANQPLVLAQAPAKESHGSFAATTVMAPRITSKISETFQSPVFKRFFGSVDLDALRINRDALMIADEIIQHLNRLNGATVRVTLEIEADIPEGAPDDVVRTVKENCRTLKFKSHSFEQQ
jgi:predicted AAA+ superfamily ATPase